MSKIEVKADFDFKVTKLEYSSETHKKEIEVFVATVLKSEDASNVGTILEEYRNLVTERDEHFAKHNSLLTSYIDRVKPAFPDFHPEYTISLLPADRNRQNLLVNFSNKVKNQDDTNPSSDLSDCYSKTDPARSTKDGLNSDHYVLRLPETVVSIKKLLIIDDVIDSGETVRILLDKLYEQRKIDENTVIKLACLYNNRKSVKTAISTMDWFKNQQKK